MALPGEDGEIKLQARNIRYRYDGMGRLVSEAEGEQECTYHYDLCGNRLEKASGDGREHYTYNRKNQLVGRETSSGSWSYLYDSQGNLIRETGPERELHYEYNARNRQTRVLSGNGCIQENLYDGEDLRAGLSEHGKRSTFIFAGGEIVAELDHRGSASRYIRGYQAAALERENHYYGLHLDEQLSTGWITGADGKIENGYEYDSFGNLLRNSVTVPNRILYGGQQYDSETGQYYLRARYYNPVVGRFLQEDSYHGDGLNLYAYCRNNPVTYYDPSGYGREHNSRAKENVKKENVTVKQGENGGEEGSRAVLDNANYAQKTYSNTFSADGRKIYSDLAGEPINTIDDLVNAINTGKVNVADLPVEYIVRDGNTLILNTRTSQALTQAGIPRSQWNAVNRTGNSLFEELLTGQLSRNKLTSEGISTVRPSGGN